MVPEPATGIKLQRSLTLGLNANWQDVTDEGTMGSDGQQVLTIDGSSGAGYYRYFVPDP